MKKDELIAVMSFVYQLGAEYANKPDRSSEVNFFQGRVKHLRAELDELRLNIGGMKVDKDGGVKPETVRRFNKIKQRKGKTFAESASDLLEEVGRQSGAV